MSKRSRRAGSTTATTPPGTPPATKPASAIGATGSSASAGSPRTASGPESATGAATADAPPSHSSTGTSRAGRRPRPRPAPVVVKAPFLERHRSTLILGGGIAVVLLVVGYVFFQSSQPAYSCSFELDPASPAPVASGSPALGQKEDDMGRTHVAVGTPVRYTYCPPASGSHYNAAGQGPIPPRFYGPDDSTIPQGWIHNMEHGGLVILYNCNDGGCNTADLDQLRALVGSFPASPACGVPPEILSPVITKFDNMKAPFAAMVWGRVLFQDKLDIPQILDFFTQYGDRTNPEQLYCNPNASPSPGASATPPITSPIPEPTGSSAPAASPAAT